MGPRSRLPLFFRVLIALGALAGVATVVALMWSDRAPGVLLDLFGDRAQQLWERIDARVVQSGRETPRPDFVVHAVLWGSVTLLMAMVWWTYVGAIISGVVVWAVSIFVEYGQTRYATTRAFEVSDMIANTTGVVIGTIAALTLFALGSLIAAIAHSVFGTGASLDYSTDS